MKIQIDENNYILNINTDSCNIEYNGEIPEDLFDNTQFYKLINNELIYDEDKKLLELQRENLNNERLYLINEVLYKTDYVALKIAEGVATKEEYASVLQARQQARDRINEIDTILGV